MGTSINMKGERLSFYKLFREKNYRVLVPIIQRDYAQGRKNKSEVRETFLSALYQYLEENKPNRDLDFVYGSLSEVNKETNFVLLDGQQRLTTLFLLHWYLYQIQYDKNSQNCQDFKSAIFKGNESMFTYETRASSSDFCDALMNNDINISNLLAIDLKKGIIKENQLSKTIEDLAWYFLSWKQDPTIQSMLTMLDAIHHKFADKKEFFDRLLDIEKPIISFQFLNLKDFKLTDDLYIKMNSRGKPLTSFENFKAKFEQYLETLTVSRIFELTFNSTKEEVSLNKYFSYKIDTEWANLFWNYRELIGDKSIFDEELKNFIRVIFANQYAIDVEVKGDKTDETFEFLLGTASARKRNDYTDDISFYKYEELGVVISDKLKVLQDKIGKEINLIEKRKLQTEKKELIEKIIAYPLYLIEAFDTLGNGNDKLKKHLSNDYNFYFNENATFENALKHSFTSNQERILFHAYTRFLIQNKGNTTGLEQWMRVIHNLAYNTIIDGAAEIARAIKSIEKMLPKSTDILNYIISNNIDGFASWQILEEKIKARLLVKATDKNWKTKIEEIEKHTFFDGQIGFILEFAGILDYYKTNNNCNWKNENEYFDKFVNYAEKAIAVFKYRNGKAYSNFNNCEFLLERAVMCKGICAVKSSQDSITTVNRLNLLHTNIVGNNIARDYSWKRFLRIDGSYSDEMNYLKNLFDDKRFSLSNVENSLKIFLSDKTNTWKDYFIETPELMRCCSKGFIKVDSDNEIYLLASIYQGANQYFAEMYTFYLWKSVIDNNSTIPFEKAYHWVKSIEDEAYISLSSINREINIYWNAEKAEYKIYFHKAKGDNDESNYPQDIQELLQNFGFTCSQDKYLLFTSFDKVKEVIETISEKLKE